jgi:hypothetical protein
MELLLAGGRPDPIAQLAARILKHQLNLPTPRALAPAAALPDVARRAYLLQPLDDRLRERGVNRRDDQNSRGTVVGARKPHRSVLPKGLPQSEGQVPVHILTLCQTGKNSHDWILPRVTLPPRMPPI